MTFFLLALFLFSPPSVFAHARSTSYSTWEIEGPRVQVTARIPMLELQRSLTSLAFPSPSLQITGSEFETELATYLLRHFRLFAGDQICTPALPSVRIAPSPDPARMTCVWELVCPSLQELQLRNDAFFAAAPAHLHFARVRVASTSPIEKVFSVHEREWSFAHSESTAKETGSHFHDYLWLGVTHILSGADHLVFLVALLLIAESITSIAQFVTGFTVAHSITLALGVLNVVRPASATIESLIGFSIIIVALENFWATTAERTHRWLLRLLGTSSISTIAAAGLGVLHLPVLALLGLSIFSIAYLLLLDTQALRQRLRWFVTFVFGLMHGFGFAGVLTEMALPTNRLAPALLGFNLGVELGQLGVVALVGWLVMRLRQFQERETRTFTIQAGSAVVLAVGICWFVTRAVGG